MAKFIVYIETDKIGSRCEVDIEIPDDELPDDWETDPELIRDMMDEAMNMAEWGFYKVEDNDD